MKNSFQLFRLFRIPVKIHWTFLLLIGYLVIDAVYKGNDFIGVALLLLMVFLIFLSVTLHEYGHALTARTYGVDTEDIVLSPIGGVARLARIPEKPVQELMVTIAGPLVNIVIALVCALLFHFLYSGSPVSLDGLQGTLFFLSQSLGQLFTDESIAVEGIGHLSLILITLMYMNLALFLFNLIPAFPMDGGRIFRALLSMNMNRVKATKIASYLGRSLAFIIGGLALGAQFDLLQPYIPSFFHNPFLIFIGYFIFQAAKNEYQHVLSTDFIKSHTAMDLSEESVIIYDDENVQTVFEKIALNSEQVYLVHDRLGNISGTIKKSEVQQKNHSGHANICIEYLLTEDFTIFPSDSTIQTVGEYIQTNPDSLIAIQKIGDSTFRYITYFSLQKKLHTL